MIPLTHRCKCFVCGSIQNVSLDVPPKCTNCGSVELRSPFRFPDSEQKVTLYHIFIGRGGVGTCLQSVQTTMVDNSRNEVNYLTVEDKNRECRDSLYNFRERYEFWYHTISDAWMHYANLLDQKAQELQREVSSLLIRGTQAVEASRIAKRRKSLKADQVTICEYLSRVRLSVLKLFCVFPKE